MSLTFLSPAILGLLLSLPLFYWLFRLIPPTPQTVSFPPFLFLIKLKNLQNTHQSAPWWLIVLRLGILAAIILSLANPILKKTENKTFYAGNRLVIVDNAWNSAHNWREITEQAQLIFRATQDNHDKVAWTTTQGANVGQEISWLPPAEAEAFLKNLEPKARHADTEASLGAIKTFLKQHPSTHISFLTTDPLPQATQEMIKEVSYLRPLSMSLFAQKKPLTVIEEVKSANDEVIIKMVRPYPEASIGTLEIGTDDLQLLTKETVSFAPGEKSATRTLKIPTPLMQEIRWIRLATEKHAANTWFMGTRQYRKNVALIASTTHQKSEGLLSASYYIDRALSPLAEITYRGNEINAANTETLTNSNLAAIILVDTVITDETVINRLNDWIEKGGTIIRFSGEKMGLTPDTLTPTPLRKGERLLEGALSWQTPQLIGEMAKEKGWDLSAPKDILIKKQILAEALAQNQSQILIELKDKTPLLSMSNHGNGRLYLFHVNADPTWSNLPMSGFFIEVLEKIMRSTHTPTSQVSAITTTDELKLITTITPWGEIISAINNQTNLTPAQHEALSRIDTPQKTAGLYQQASTLQTLNLLSAPQSVIALSEKELPHLVERMKLNASSNISLSPWMLFLAFVLFVLDTAIVYLPALKQQISLNSKAGAILIMSILGFSLSQAHAEPLPSQSPSQTQAHLSANATRLAYIKTTESQDLISAAGLAGLGHYIASRTSFEPADPVSVAPHKDELAFYPLIYWPITASTPMPTDEAIKRLKKYMENGGTLLIDTQDYGLNLFTPGETNPTVKKILFQLNITNLMAVDERHVLTKTFYLLKEFPGQYTGSPLWVESTTAHKKATALRGDGISGIIVTGNNFAHAWATDKTGRYLYQIENNNPRSREMAFRAGVNIVLYTLTGHYKADQVHLPALLERLKR